MTPKLSLHQTGWQLWIVGAENLAVLWRTHHVKVAIAPEKAAIYPCSIFCVCQGGDRYKNRLTEVSY